MNNKLNFGFWVYLMTDCMLFAGLFATYAVLRDNTFGGITIDKIFNGPFVLTETLILLTSSFIAGMATLVMQKNNKQLTLTLLTIIFLLGLSFVLMELNEFSKLITEGNSWQRSGFLSAFFTLVGTHGLHITSGLLWLIVLIIQIVRQGLTKITMQRLTLFSLFWHFLDIVWIFIFSLVYLMGAL